MSVGTKASPAHEAWALIFDLLFSERPPRVPVIAQEFDISPMVVKLLFLLDPAEELPMSRIAAGLHCDASNVTGIVDRLEERGLLERRDDATDRRVKRLALTDAGVELRRRVLERLYEPPAQIAALPTADQRALRDILGRAVAG